MSILEYNGGIVIAMKGKECVAIAADRRLGIRAQTVGMDFQKVYEMGPRLYLGLPGLATDTATVFVISILSLKVSNGRAFHVA
ncbi:proteasome subunit beta type-3 [Trichonephila clavata]|uniref:Proteasome subunit beta type-3 n=1 Tax=Trichonephila clavata TaxID=2740835 RepID=A0A8X6H1D7_TRICU|nr:proteasome subunit beta type-3 [Trichonephila clavata]